MSPLHTGDSVFLLQQPDQTGARVLLRGEVGHAEGGVVEAILDVRDLDLERGQDALLFFEERLRFKQQLARVAGIRRQDDGRHRVSFELKDDPVCAETRGGFRVSAVTAQLTAQVDGEGGLPVLDVSATGMAVISAERHSLGDVVVVSLEFQGEHLAGTACVQSVTSLDDGTFRYGLYCEDDRTGACLQASLTRVSLLLQKERMAMLAIRS